MSPVNYDCKLCRNASPCAAHASAEEWDRKHPSQPAAAAAPAPATSPLASSSPGRRAAGDTNNPANNGGVGDWRSRSQSKDTWLGAKIPATRPLAAIGALQELRSETELAIAEEVDRARAEGQSWTAIGTCLRTSGEAARQRYGTK